MLRVFGNKTVVVPLIIISAGLLVVSAAFVYYGFHLGIKPCTGSPSDAANCGDADLGGVVFVFIGVPITLFGVVSLLVALAMTHLKPHFNRRYFLRIVYILLTVLVTLLLTMLFA